MRSNLFWFESRWEWEKTRQIAVFSLEPMGDREKPQTISLTKRLLDEFGLPINVVDGNILHRTDVERLRSILSETVKSSRIDYREFEDKLRDIRRREGILPYGILLMIDKDSHQFEDYGETDQRAIYGIGNEEGLVLLAYRHSESVRHEVAHMLGLQHHSEFKPGCIMNWLCNVPDFCDECRLQIAEIWHDEIAGTRRSPHGG